MSDIAFQIRLLGAEHREWAVDLLGRYWGSPMTITRGRMRWAPDLPGFVAVGDGEPIGLLTYEVRNGECEVVTLNSLVEGIGVGTALLKSAVDAAVAAGCRRVWLVTTNDNTPALDYFQKRGFRLVAVYPDAVTRARALKPEIPIYGMESIPIRDEIELELAPLVNCTAAPTT